MKETEHLKFKLYYGEEIQDNLDYDDLIGIFDQMMAITLGYADLIKVFIIEE